MHKGQNVRSKNVRQEEGFVLIAALMVIFLIVAIVSTVAAITSADLKSSARARAVIKTRFVAESVSDSIFATIARDKSQYIQNAKERFAVDPSINPPTLENNPLFKSDVTASAYGTQWFYVNTNGKLGICSDSLPDPKLTCFVARMTKSGGAGPLAREEVILDVIARGGCRLDATILKNCIYRNFQQVLRTRAYVENVQISETEDSGFVGVKPVSYIPSDIIDGIVSTNDTRGVYYCGDIVDDPKRDLRSNTPIPKPAIASICDTSPLPSNFIVGGELKFLPGQVNRTGSNVGDSGGNNTVFSSLSGKPESDYHIGKPLVPVSMAVIELAPDGVRIDGNSRAYPSNGVIYVNGNATVYGKFSRGISIYATGDITIGGDGITYESGLGTSRFTGESPDDNPADLPDGAIVGIAAGKDIILDCDQVGTKCDDKNVVAVLNAPNGKVFNNKWDSSAVPVGGATAQPEFTLYGSIVSYYHPVFGSYYAVEPGVLKNGWIKNLKWDDRLLSQQPPYFFRTTQANVVRGALDESPCDDATDVYGGGGPICT